jgi:endonuclease/exonuclease/phosphatase family metal-dependent hydrolase
MRLIGYNILDGGVGRADPLAEVIEAQRPDAVGLVEADDTAVVERIAARLKMDVLHAPGRSHAVALLSRYPIIESINHAPLHPERLSCFVEAKIAAPTGEFVVGLLHLRPHAAESDEAEREKEVALILDLMSVHRDSKVPHVLMGDFNSNSPVQRIDPDRLKPRTRKEYEENGNVLPRRVIQRILDAGYTDSFAALNPAATDAATFSTRHPGQRVDYIFTHGVSRSSLLGAWIETDRLAKYASDHFPVGLEIG